MSLFPGPVWLIGCGNMAGAMLERWLASGLEPSQVTVVRPSGRAPAPGIRTLAALPEDEAPALVLLGVKPQKLDEVAPSLAPALQPETILISILAGVEWASLRARFPNPRNIVRAMPNLPVRVGKGAVGLYSPDVDPGARAAVAGLMTPLGLAEWFQDEPAFDLVTLLSGSGTAFAYRFIDGLAKAAAQLGMPADQAQRFSRAAIEGAAALAVKSDASLSDLAEQVTSPAGTTEAGLDVLDSGLDDLLARTLEAAGRRSQELAAAARRG
jgi:pyrroline-5-carboxylate reductase